MTISRRRFVEGAAAAVIALATGCNSEGSSSKSEPKLIGERNPVIYANGLIYNRDPRIEVWCDTAPLTSLIRDPQTNLGMPDSIILINVIAPSSVIANKKDLEQDLKQNGNLDELVSTNFPNRIKDGGYVFRFISTDEMTGVFLNDVRRGRKRPPKNDSELKIAYGADIFSQWLAIHTNHREDVYSTLRLPKPSLKTLMEKIPKNNPFQVRTLSNEILRLFFNIPTPTPTPKSTS